MWGEDGGYRRRENKVIGCKPGIVAHALNCSTQGTEAGRSQSSSSACSTECIPV